MLTRPAVLTVMQRAVLAGAPLLNKEKLVAPIGPGTSGLPVGVQIVAGRYRDLTALRFASLLEDAGYAFRPPPRPSVLPADHNN